MFEIKLVFALTAQRAARSGQDGGAQGFAAVLENMRCAPEVGPMIWCRNGSHQIV